MEINLDEIIRRFARLHPRIMNWPISRMNELTANRRKKNVSNTGEWGGGGGYS